MFREFCNFLRQWATESSSPLNSEPEGTKEANLRDTVSFFVFGVLNNLIYVIILSAAGDLVGSLPKGIVLLADIMPSLLIKLIGPYFILSIPYSIRICACSIISIASLQIIAWSDQISYRLIGVMLASLSSGLGEMSFLMLTSYYNSSTISAWSSGTGGAGILGALSFLILTTWWGLSVRTSLNLVSILPASMAFTYFFILTQRSSSSLAQYTNLANEQRNANEDDFIEDNIIEDDNALLISDASFHQKLSMVKPLLWKYLMPMFVVYWAEYTINMGITPTILFPLEKTPFRQMRDHYVTYAFTYQLGVFISRSSVSIFPIRRVWIPSLSQVGVLVIFITQALLLWMPGVYFVLIVIVIEGLFGGATYVNTYNNIRMDANIAEQQKEFSMGVVGVADSIGITFAGLCSLWVEPWLCKFNPICERQNDIH